MPLNIAFFEASKLVSALSSFFLKQYYRRQGTISLNFSFISTLLRALGTHAGSSFTDFFSTLGPKGPSDPCSTSKEVPILDSYSPKGVFLPSMTF